MAICSDSNTQDITSKDKLFEGLAAGKMNDMILHEIDGDNAKLSCGYLYIGDELSPRGMKMPVADPLEWKQIDEKPLASGFPSYRELLDNEN